MEMFWTTENIYSKDWKELKLLKHRKDRLRKNKRGGGITEIGKYQKTRVEKNLAFKSL